MALGPLLIKEEIRKAIKEKRKEFWISLKKNLCFSKLANPYLPKCTIKHELNFHKPWKSNSLISPAAFFPIFAFFILTK